MWTWFTCSRCQRLPCRWRWQRDGLSLKHYTARLSTKAPEDEASTSFADRRSPSLEQGPQPDENAIKQGHGDFQPVPNSLNLPLSPLIDPKLIAARQRYRTRKTAPGELSASSKKLRTNPYGMNKRLIPLCAQATIAYFHSKL